MKIIKHADWLARAKQLFGPSPANWKFVCSNCKNVQSGQDFVDAGVSQQRAGEMLAFSCIGRVKPGTGCDYTSGGLVQLHTTEVEFPDGKRVPVFEFAEATHDKETAAAGRS